MKKYISISNYILTTVIFVLGLSSCNEKIYVEEDTNEEIPVVESFEPTSAEVGAILKIYGQNLNYADNVWVGDVQADIVSKVTNSYMEVRIDNYMVDGIVKVLNSNNEGTSSSGELTIIFNEPVLETIPSGGYINENVVITGSNLKYIKQIFVGETEAAIVSQDDQEVVFSIPFNLNDVSTLSYVYASASGDITVTLDDNGFSVQKSWPEFVTVPTKAMINSEITVIGNNMNVVDSVYFASSKVEVTAQDETSFSFVIPNDEELEGYQSISVYSYGGTEISTGAVLRVIAKLEWIIEDFENFSGDPFSQKKSILPVYTTGLNGNEEILAAEGNFYASLLINYDQSQYNNGGSTYSEYYYKGDDNLIDINEFEDPWVHLWINTNNTTPYFVFYCDLSESVDGVTSNRGTHYVKRLNSSDYGEGWQLFAWRMSDLKFRSGSSADPYSSDLFSIYNLKTFRIQFRTTSDIPIENSEFHFDSFMIVDGKLKDAHDVTTIGDNE